MLDARDLGAVAHACRARGREGAEAFRALGAFVARAPCDRHSRGKGGPFWLADAPLPEFHSHLAAKIAVLGACVSVKSRSTDKRA